MQTYIERQLESDAVRNLAAFPAVAILGPRQSGKSTLAKRLAGQQDNAIVLDLERDSDLNKLENPELFFSSVPPATLVCLDEIQRKPSMFPILRWVIDENRLNGRFLILGSASAELLRQSSESLAGRICYLELTPLTVLETESSGVQLSEHWLRGGFPDSLLAGSDEQSLVWRENFIDTFLARDIPQLGFNLSTPELKRLWRMLAHLQGQTANYSKLAESLGVSPPTVKRHLDLLEQTYMVRLLPPYASNTKKRLIKAPKVYIRDSGILHSLLNIEHTQGLLSHPVLGASWEGFALETILGSISNRWQPSFYRSSSGLELDLVLERGEKRLAIEFKVSKAPKVGKGFWYVLKDTGIEKAFVVSPVDAPYPIADGVSVTNIQSVIRELL